MSALYVCSPTPGGGKTTLAIGLALRLSGEGLAVSYMKPIGQASTESGDPDALFARQVLRLRLPIETICPVDAANPPEDAIGRLRAAFDTASRGRDVVVLDGAEESTGGSLGLSGPEVAAALDSKVLVVAAYQAEGLAESIVSTAAAYGERVLGAVITAIPETAWQSVQEQVRAELVQAGIPLVGALPLARTLMSLTVAELAEGLGGEIIRAAEWADKPVESFMLATISDTTAQWYFRRQDAKAVIARGDRPDAHIVALETETSCLIVTGGKDPQPHVLGLATDLEVPIVKVTADSAAVLDRVSDLLPGVRFRQKHKLPVLDDLLDKHFDFAALRRGLGLRQEATP